MAMITKVSADRIKRRLILDCKVSDTNAGTVQSERIIFPLVTDVVDDSLFLLSQCANLSEQVELIVLDFKDAFWQLPLLKCERKYFVAKFKDIFIVWVRVAQGSKNGPQLWGRISAFTGRCTQSLYPANHVRAQIYTDEPVVVARGTAEKRDTVFAVLILL